MSRCGQCVHYKHVCYHNFSDDKTPLITSMTNCPLASDGYPYRGENCVTCSNFVLKKFEHSFFSPESHIIQLTLF